MILDPKFLFSFCFFEPPSIYGSSQYISASRSEASRRVRGMLKSGKQFSLDSRVDLAEAVLDQQTDTETGTGGTDRGTHQEQQQGAGRGRSVRTVLLVVVDSSFSLSFQFNPKSNYPTGQTWDL